MNDTHFQVFTPAEAVKYLREERGLIFTVDGLKSRRRRHQATPLHVTASMSLWTKEELDALQPTKRTKRVPDFDKKKGRKASSTSLRLRAS